ncbi:MAG: efflux RND transporter periplasmic adaptor subunit [Chitinophagales bacterium]
MKSNKTLYIIAGIVLGIMVIGIIGKKAGWWGKGNVKQVAIEAAARRSVVETVTASGKLYPETEVKISSEVSGEIIELRVKEGDSVKKGDLLLVINPVIYESVVAQSQAGVSQVRANRSGSEASYKNAKALFDQATITFNRNKQLHDEKIISDAEFDQATNALKNAETALATAREQLNAASFTINSSEAQLKQASDNLKKTRIYAPESGIISLLNVKLGERVVGTAQMAGTELIRIADLQHMQAQVDVNENDVLRVKIGDTAEVEVDAYLDKKFKGIVSEIAYSSTTATAIVSTSQATNFTVKVKLVRDSYAELVDPEHGHAYPFRPGMSATVDIKTRAKENVLTVPIQSVTTREEKDLKPEGAVADKKKKDPDEDSGKKDMKEIVFVVDHNVVKAIPVKTGIQDATYIEVTSGVTEGMNVIKAPFKLISKSLKPEDVVEVVSEKELFKAEAKKE